MNTATILIGNVQDRLKDIPDQTVQSCITSPPYWGLRDYGTATWDGGDPTCDHKDAKKKSRYDYSMPESAQAGTQKNKKPGTDAPKWADKCPNCGATKQDNQLGLEATPEQYVENMVAVFREVWRILKNDGVLWLNLGDSYVGYKGDNYLKNKSSSKLQSSTTVPSSHMVGTPQTSGLKSKDLVGIPWRTAFALQADGWYLRQDIIWHKPNPMPESVTDRCTKAHEYLFMLTKNQRYYFDNDAIREPLAESTKQRDKTPRGRSQNGGKSQESLSGYDYSRQGLGNMTSNPKGRNRRSVWTIPTKPFKDAHFAVMPEALCEPPILATSRPDELILDPFTGSGTVAVVALRHNRNFIGCELNPSYAQIAEKRILNDQPILNQVLLQ